MDFIQTINPSTMLWTDITNPKEHTHIDESCPLVLLIQRNVSFWSIYLVLVLAKYLYISGSGDITSEWNVSGSYGRSKMDHNDEYR